MSNGVPGPSTTSATCEKIVNELAEVEKPTGTPPPNEMENNNVVAASPKALSSAGEARFPIDVDVLKNVQQQDDTVFALDEDTVRSDLCDMPVKHFMGDIDALSGDDESSDDADPDPLLNNNGHYDSSTLLTRCRDFVSNPRTKRFPSFPIAASLPVTISRGGFWPSGELMDNEANDSNRLEPSRAKNIFKAHDDEMYRNMQAYSRSIQPADDPERLFGERPHRRYRDEDLSGGAIGGNCSR